MAIMFPNMKKRVTLRNYLDKYILTILVTYDKCSKAKERIRH